MTREQPSLSGAIAALRALSGPPPYPLTPPSVCDIAYATASRGISPLADIWLAETDRPSASVLLVHGGGFLVGSRRMKPVRIVADHLVKQGISVCAPDYRMLLRGGGFRAGRLDVGDAFAWWQGQASRFNLDPTRISIAGLSAGAALSWASASSWITPPHRFVGIYGAYDLNWKQGPGRLLRPLLFRDESGDAASWSPVNRAELPCPVLMIHGDADSLAPISGAQGLLEARHRHGAETRLEVFEGQEHAFLNNPTTEASQRALSLLATFLIEGAR